MKNAVSDYLAAKENIFKLFGCSEEYFIKTLVNYKWVLNKDEDTYILTYWPDGGKKNSSIVLRKDGKPMVMRKGDYTMVVGIDCVKIAFLLSNNLEQ